MDHRETMPVLRTSGFSAAGCSSTDIPHLRHSSGGIWMLDSGQLRLLVPDFRLPGFGFRPSASGFSMPRTWTTCPTALCLPASVPTTETTSTTALCPLPSARLPSDSRPPRRGEVPRSGTKTAAPPVPYSPGTFRLSLSRHLTSTRSAVPPVLRFLASDAGFQVM